MADFLVPPRSFDGLDDLLSTSGGGSGDGNGSGDDTGDDTGDDDGSGDDTGDGDDSGDDDTGNGSKIVGEDVRGASICLNFADGGSACACGVIAGVAALPVLVPLNRFPQDSQ